MDVNFCKLKQKDVISLNDGKNLGKVCDITFRYPENTVVGITVTGGKGFRFNRAEQFIPIAAVVKIGDDAVLVKTAPKGEGGKIPPPCPPQPPCPPSGGRRSFDEYE